MKTNNLVFFALSLFAVLLLTACADDIRVNDNEIFSEKDLSELTCFSTEIPEETRTNLRKDELGIFGFRWTGDDYIYVKDDNGKWQRSQKIELVFGGSKARFSLPGEFNKSNTYSVVYSKSFNGTSDPVVTIPSVQVQKSPNNSDHLGDVGDCAWATANRNGSGGFSFTMQHMVSYVMFEPRVEVDGTEVVINRVKITEVNGKDICGKITLGETGVDSKETKTGKNVITVLCGEDVELVELGKKKMEDATTYGFRVNNFNYEPYDKDTYGDETPRVYIVIKPGENYEFDVEYETSTSEAFEQVTIHRLKYTNKVTNDSAWVCDYDIASYEADPEWVQESSRWTAISRPYTSKEKKEKTKPVTLVSNKYYKMRHKLSVVPSPTVTPNYDYHFDTYYYMWGAKEWYWKKAVDAGVNHPVGYDGIQTSYVPQKGDDSWFYDDVQYVKDGVTGMYEPYEWNASHWKIGTMVRHRQANARGLHLWKNGSALTANQMSYYVMYGDAHYENRKSWTLKYYNSYNDFDPSETRPIVCYGGVWLKTKEAILRDNPSLTWPNDEDSPKATNLAAPFTYDATAGQNWQQFEGVQYNLRYCAPWSNYRKTYTNRAKYLETGEWKRPWELDTTKDSLDYFFVPCLGRIEYNNGSPKLTLVGSQGFYWTRTPLAYNFGQTPYYYNVPIPYLEPAAGGTSVPYDYENTTCDNAFYLNIHYNYIALSWQQNSNYMLTGMGVATANSAGFKFY